MNKILILTLSLFTYQIVLPSECKSNKYQDKNYIVPWKMTTGYEKLWNSVKYYQSHNPQQALVKLNELELKGMDDNLELMNIYYMQGSIFYDNKKYYDAMIAFKKLLNLPIKIEPNDEIINKILTEARTKIGIMYMDGLATEVNLIEAADYLILGMANNYIEPGLKRITKKRLEKIKTRLINTLTNINTFQIESSNKCNDSRNYAVTVNDLKKISQHDNYIFFTQGSILYDNENYNEAMIAFKELLKLQMNINSGDQVMNTLMTQARAKIGMMYMDGKGTEINFIEAADYLILAMANICIPPILKKVIQNRLEIIKQRLENTLTNLNTLRISAN